MNFNDFPKYVRAAMNSASGPLGGRCYINSVKVNSYLCDKFSLNTDCNKHEIENFGIIDFDWKNEKWFAAF